ncbi:MAG: N-acetylmuramoyl-L-alanine amidase [candidate division NC10 bacterium]
MRRWVAVWGIIALSVGLGWQAADGRSLLVEVQTREGVQRGQLPLVALEDGTSYVLLDRLAALLKVKPGWSGKSARAIFKVGDRSAVLTHNQREVLVQGKVLQLSSPPRILAGGWAVPEQFLSKVLPKLLPEETRVSVAHVPPGPPAKSPRSNPSLTALRVRSYPSFTRVVVEASGPFEFEIQEERREVRARLSGLSLAGARTEEVGDGLIRQVSLDRSDRGARLRTVLEDVPVETKRFVLGDPYRLVLDFHRAKPAQTERAQQPQAFPLRHVVLDAGHGGHDPGAMGPSGLQEKEVVLDVTKRLVPLLEEGLGVKVSLTRTTDYFVPLRERTSFANAQRADLFVSIHANAHRASVSEGVETYFLSSEATDNESRQVAALENEVIRLEGGSSKAQADLLKTILWDLAQSGFQEESSRLAETVLDSMTRALAIANRGVKQAGFYVLGGAAMPAILVEIGFLTNPKEERKLRDPHFRERVARAIYAGLAAYKRRYDQKMGAAQAVGTER